MSCRNCKNQEVYQFLNLGTSPPSNAFLRPEQLSEPEVFFPLSVGVCTKCWLVQIQHDVAASELFNSKYVYFSSNSSTWLTHARNFVEGIIPRLGLNDKSFVVEIASNDGYLLQFMKAQGIKVLGIEPTHSTARVAQEKGIETLTEFFGAKIIPELLQKFRKPDLIIGNNVLAHVPDLNDFVGALSAFLAPCGIVVLEFPHLLNLLRNLQFDTIYHEHYSYLSLSTVKEVMRKYGLKIFDVEKLTTHGGSLRVFACHECNSERAESATVVHLLSEETDGGLNSLLVFSSFQHSVQELKNQFLHFLLHAGLQQKRVLGYGAAAKASTLLNFAGVRPDLLPFVADISPHKQGMFIPGVRIPVVAVSELVAAKPDYVVIFPWNIAEEIEQQLKCIREWGGQFVKVIPSLEIN